MFKFYGEKLTKKINMKLKSKDEIEWKKIKMTKQNQ